MQDHQIQGFYDELADLCSKYDVEGIVGMWLSGDSDTYGFLHGSPQDGGPVSVVCKGVSDKLIEWCDDAHPGPLKFYTKAVALIVRKPRI